MNRKPWLATYGDRIPVDIDTDRHASIVHLMQAAIDRHADRCAFRSAGNALSYREFDALATAFAAYLQQRLGVRKGDRIAVMLPNLLAFPIAFAGIARAGAIQVNVNPLYTPRELEHQLDDAGVEVIVVYAGSTPTLAEIVGRTGVRKIVTVDVGDGGATALPGPPVDARLTGTVRFAEALSQGAELAYTPVDLTGNDLLFLQYTGGTTGLSKGAALSHRNLLANIEQFKAVQSLADEGEVVVTALPLYHIFALMVNFLTMFSIGAENWLVANPRDADGLVETLKRARPSVFTGVNTLFAALTAHPRIREVDWSRLHLAGGGGAAVIAATSAKWQRVTGTFIREGYGLSETSPVLSFNPSFVDAFSHSTGLPLPSTDIKLLDEEGREVAIGEAGEVCAKGPQVMRGYWNKPEANAEAYTADGYFRTGDVGVFDAQGFLKIVDRKKDMIIVSGFNVYPNEVESVVTGLPGVAECACIGVPDDRTGEAVKLFVVKAPGAAVDADAIVDRCRAEMAAYKVPRMVRFLDALPKSTVGKILRRELRDAA
ncbi:MAG: AMP-binding protein [Proteobacteria bacterium]|nr:AMP-binding protein [Pseudomonadota bacterium]